MRQWLKFRLHQEVCSVSQLQESLNVVGGMLIYQCLEEIGYASLLMKLVYSPHSWPGHSHDHNHSLLRLVCQHCRSSWLNMPGQGHPSPHRRRSILVVPLRLQVLSLTAPRPTWIP